MVPKRIFRSIALLMLVTSAACTSAPRSVVEYKSAPTRPQLEIPPGLDQLPATGSDTGGATTYSGFSAEQGTSRGSGAGDVLPEFPKVQLEHQYGEYWLLVSEKPDAVWTSVRGFVFSLGLTVASQNKAAGVIETDWAENHAKLSHGFFSKIWNPFEDTGTRDRYRFQLLRGTQPGTTEVHLVHQGMQQVTAAADSEGSYREIWQPAPPDRPVEAEMLRLLMVHFGMGDAASRAIVASSGLARPRAVLGAGDGGPQGITLREPPDDAWTRVGLVLDRTAGVTVEDRDRANRVYSVRVSHAADTNKKPGFFARIFGGKTASSQPQQYHIALAPKGDATVIVLQEKDGKPDTSDAGKAFLKQLYEQLR